MNALHIPKQINILGNEWKIEIKPDKPLYSGKSKVHGLCNYEKHLIQVKNDFRFPQTLFHEFSHAFLFETNLLPNTEINVSLLELFLSQTFKQIYPTWSKSKNEKKQKTKRKN